MSLDGQPPFQSARLALGNGQMGLEVVIVAATQAPGLPAVRSAWKARNAGRAAPLLLVVLHGARTTLCGPAGDDPPAYPNIDLGQAERICREALEQPDRHAALRSLQSSLSAVDSALPGIRNEGFLATHELARGLRADSWRTAWAAAGERARPILNQRGDTLLQSLGFQIERVDQVTSVLRAGAGGRRVAVAVLLNQSETPELQTDRFGGLSPVSYALAVAERENLPYVVVAHGSRLRLYPVKIGVGVGRRGRTETFIDAHTGLLRDDEAAYLWLLFSAEALIEGGTLDRIIDESKRFAGLLAEDLRDRIYGEVIPRLAEGLAAARGLRQPSATDLAETYEMAMTVLFRLLFIAYAEDKDLLPYRANGLYRSRSLKTKATELLELTRSGTAFDEGDSLWDEVKRLFRAVEKGNREWSVPEYDGGLFASDPEVSRVGAQLNEVTLPNQVFGEVLKGLLLIQSPEGWGPVDFRSLGVREFGTVYEGLLESELSVAETDLTFDETGRNKGFYRPCRAGEVPKVTRRQVYLHDKSGARKSTGSYFTKEFAVEHLLDRALEPALADHLSRLDGLDEDAAGEAFFDFRVADIAMGSGHFLVAAVDRIERGLTQYLSRRSLPGVRAELARLRASAEEALGPTAQQVEIEDSQLLRRLIARRCIYGVDLNPVSVGLARVSIWIHTFVPGLPLSLLDRNLVVGNSLVGIGQIAEIEAKARADDLPLFSIDAERLVGEAVEPLRRLARIADATATEVARARRAMNEAQKAVEPAAALCDIVTACRMEGTRLTVNLQNWDEIKAELSGSRTHRSARRQIESLAPLHFPVAFPEVFLRERNGFDVLLGNPPWEEATVEEDRFWNAHVPGLQAMPQREQERLKASMRESRPDLFDEYHRSLERAAAVRRALVSGPYPGMGVGDPDLYKAFCWRFWELSAHNGHVGVVLPRSATTAKGSADFRARLLASASIDDLCYLINDRGWVFDDAEYRYTISLTSLAKGIGPEERVVRLRGPYRSMARFEAGIRRTAHTFPVSEVLSWTDTASLPLIPTEESLDIFVVMRASPRLDLNDGHSWRARPHRELDATNDKHLMDVESRECPQGFWPVFKGESFDHWQPDTGTYYAWANPDTMLEHLLAKRINGRRLRKSVWYEFADRPTAWFNDPRSLPCFAPRIAFKDIVRNTDSRTMKVGLVPPEVFIANTAPFLLWPRGNHVDQAYLLAILGSIPLDWYARRFVELHMNFFLFNTLPVPRPLGTNALYQRVVALAARMAASDERYAEWVETLGAELHRIGAAEAARELACGRLDADLKLDYLCELDAVVAHLYGLEERHLRHIFETFHVGWEPGTTADHPTLGDYNERLQRTLDHYRAWSLGGR